jgi:hypothetical protein
MGRLPASRHMRTTGAHLVWGNRFACLADRRHAPSVDIDNAYREDQKSGGFVQLYFTVLYHTADTNSTGKFREPFSRSICGLSKSLHCAAQSTRIVSLAMVGFHSHLNRSLHVQSTTSPISCTPSNPCPAHARFISVTLADINNALNPCP